MSRYIDDDETLKIIKKMLYETALNNFTTDRKFADDCEEIAEHRLATWIGLVPTADVVEVKHGRWIDDRLCTTLGGTYEVQRCSVCGEHYEEVGYDWNYCPNCGAKMDEREDEE